MERIVARFKQLTMNHEPEESREAGDLIG